VGFVPPHPRGQRRTHPYPSLSCACPCSIRLVQREGSHGTIGPVPEGGGLFIPPCPRSGWHLAETRRQRRCAAAGVLRVSIIGFMRMNRKGRVSRWGSPTPLPCASRRECAQATEREGLGVGFVPPHPRGQRGTHPYPSLSCARPCSIRLVQREGSHGTIGPVPEGGGLFSFLPIRCAAGRNRSRPQRAVRALPVLTCTPPLPKGAAPWRDRSPACPTPFCDSRLFSKKTRTHMEETA
jgi:hypothetical protein